MVGSLGLLCRYKKILFCLGCSSRPSTKIFFSQAGHVAMLGRLSLSVCLCARTLPMNALWPRVTQVAARASVASLKKEVIRAIL